MLIQAANTRIQRDVSEASRLLLGNVSMAAGNVEVVDPLLARADPHIRNSKAATAVASAATGGHLEAVLRLVQAGSAWRGRPDADVVKLLCKKSSYKCARMDVFIRLRHSTWPGCRCRAQGCLQALRSPSVILLLQLCDVSQYARPDGAWHMLLCRPSYVEGRLKLAEKERIRARAKAEAAAATGGDGTGGGVSRATALAEAAAQADANMMALLEEESKLQVNLLQAPQR